MYQRVHKRREDMYVLKECRPRNIHYSFHVDLVFDTLSKQPNKKNNEVTKIFSKWLLSY